MDRFFTALIAWGHTVMIFLVIVWPLLTSEPFPFSGYRNIETGMAVFGFALVALFLAISVSVFWNLVCKHQWIFVCISMLAFLLAVIIVKPAVGIGFAAVSLLIRSRRRVS
jgi:hypothetical protein